MVQKDKITKMIEDNSIIIFSKTYCPSCKKAKQALKGVAKLFEVVELDEQDDTDEWQDILKDITGARTVPRVFIGGKFVGGGDDMVAKAADGSLAELCEAAGAPKA